MSQAMPTANDKSDRIVFGYTRIHCENYVPAPLVELIRRFYNLWIHRCFSKDEIATLRTLKRNDTVAFALPNAKFMLNGSKFDYYLQVCCLYNCKHKFGELVRYKLMLKAALPGDIEFISCVVKTNGPVHTITRWTRVHTRDGEIYGNSGLYHLDVIELDRLQPTLSEHSDQCWGLSDTISLHVDIKQIKYTPEAQQQDIDAWEVAKKGKWHWKHAGLTPQTLEKGRTCDEKRDFVCKLTEINVVWNYALFRIERTMLALPMNVSAVNMKVVAKGNIGEMYFEISTIIFLNGKMIRKRTDMDDFEHPMTLEIDMEIVEVFDLHEQDIDEENWSKYGVSSHINVPNVFNITP